MGKRQKQLAHLLGDEPIALPVLNQTDITESRYEKLVYECYLALGGNQSYDVLKIRLGNWDMQFNGSTIELDEELYFNRYREVTLNSKLYDLTAKFPLSSYKAHCENFELACLKAGKSPIGKWTSTGSEKQFGAANRQGDLTGNSSPRWKQRAFYDYVKDLTPLVLGFNVVRIAIWDEVLVAGRQMTIENALEYSDRKVRDAIVELIEQRSLRDFPSKTVSIKKTTC